MGALFDYFDNNPGRLIHKWWHYFGIYERHFASFRGKPVRILEFGVFHGGSLQMWKHYFGPQAHIIGVDINPRCAELAEPGIDIVLGDQEDRQFHAKLREKYGEFDIVIDDGGHSMAQQIVTFEEIYPVIKPGGIYLAEDLHTSYNPSFGGGLRNPASFIEYSKRFIDQLHAWYPSTPMLTPDLVTCTAYGLHFYDSILVIEKNVIHQPVDLIRGEPSFPTNAVEYQLLAEHAISQGNRDAALRNCQRLLALEPRSERGLAMMKLLG